MSIIPKLTNAGRSLLLSALAGDSITFTKIKIGSGSVVQDPLVNDLWYDTVAEKLYVYANGWITDTSHSLSRGSAAPSSPTAGDWWYNTADNSLNIYSIGWASDTEHTFTKGGAAPDNPSANDLWYNTSNSTLYTYGDGWAEYSSITYTEGIGVPSNPANGDLWYNTSTSKLYTYSEAWTASTENITIANSAPSTPAPGDLFYHTLNEELYKYREQWDLTSVTWGETAPSAPSNGDYWCDNHIEGRPEIWYQYINGWNQIAGSKVYFVTGTFVPSTFPVDGTYLYDDDIRTYYVYSEGEWVAPETQPIISFNTTEPSNPTIGQLWYQGVPPHGSFIYTSSGWVHTDIAVVRTYVDCPLDPNFPTDGDIITLYPSYDTYVYHTGWIAETEREFYHGSTRPVSPSNNDLWYDTGSNSLKRFSSGWTEDTDSDLTRANTAPAEPSSEDLWYNTTTSKLYVYLHGWTPDTINQFFYSASPPINPAIGYLWYNTLTESLLCYGPTWITDTVHSLAVGSSSPAFPDIGDYWYDTTANQLNVYGDGWTEDNGHTFYYLQEQPAAPDAGDYWYNLDESQLYVYTNNHWSMAVIGITCGTTAPITPDSLSDLVLPKITLSISDITQGTDYVTLIGTYSNANVAETFHWTETGIYAKGDNNIEILYAYCNTGEHYDTIFSNSSGRTESSTISINVLIADAEDVTAIIGENAVYATKEQLKSHIDDRTNPHGVTAEQLGLGNVLNLAPDNMPVEFEAASALAEPESGETLATLFAKIKKAVNNLIAHLRADNPHSITPSKINAAPASHTHSTDAITTGTLAISRGGTGVGSLDALATQLQPYFKPPTMGGFVGNGATKRKISLSFTPSAVLLFDSRGRATDGSYVYGGLCINGYGVRTPNCTSAAHITEWSDNHTAIMIGSKCFYVNANGNCRTNTSSENYFYIAFQ